MASTIQIVPKFQFPYVETLIYDNTEYTDTAATAVDDSYKTIHVFRSGKGVDNKVVKKTTTEDFKSVFGQTNFKKYGQPLMMPYASLGSERTSVYAMRIMPDDATYANAGVFCYYRVANATVTENEVDPEGNVVYQEDGITPKTKTVQKKMFQVFFRQETHAPEVDAVTNRITNETTAVHSEAEMQAFMAKGTKEIPATDGGDNWKCVPLIYFMSCGRGMYGNNYKWRVSNNTEYEKDYERTMYSFEILSDESSVEKIAAYVGSLNMTTVSGKSVLINDVIDEYDDGEYPVKIFSYEDSIDILYDAYVTFLNELAAADPATQIIVPDKNEFDILFGKYVNSKSYYENFQVVGVNNDAYPITDDANYVNIGEVSGTSLDGGNEGSFGTFIGDSGEVINGYEEKMGRDMYIAAQRAGLTYLRYGEATVEDYYYALAFNGKLDKAILATRRVPADYLLDANYSYFTKLSFAQFAAARNDCVAYIDCGTDIHTFSTATIKRLISLYGKSTVFSNRLISINPHHIQVADPFNAKKVTVSVTYWIASALPTHWRENGFQTPFAKSFAHLSNFVKNSVEPVVDLYESEIMEELAANRFNYIEAIDENVFQRGIQNTAQSINSDLLEESNMHILTWLKRNIERDNYDNLYNFANASDRATFKQVEEAKYESIKGSIVESFDIRFDMNSWESERQILHCYVEVTFRTIMKRGIIEIDVNKREYTA